ncbi:MAG: hypothetical protein IV100_15325 [Myxococcales bacterium]|nr:hypothetical protein [Myxococcales bacterium]
MRRRFVVSSFIAALASSLGVACAGPLDAVRPVMPERAPEATTIWPGYVTSDDRMVLEDAERRIDAARKGEVLLVVRDARGIPAQGVDVELSQVSHDFKFGVEESFTPAVWGQLVRAGINHGTVIADWTGTEPQPDNWTLEAVEASYGAHVLPDMGVDLRASAALWMTPERTPEHVRRLDAAALRSAIERHVRGLATRLRGDIVLWEALREPNAEWASALGRDPNLMVSLAVTAAEAVRSVDSVTPIGVSFTHPFGEGQAITPLAFLKRLTDAALDFDVVGLEVYYNGYKRVKRDAGKTVSELMPRRSLAELAEILGEFDRFGKTLHISGVSVPSVPYPTDRAIAGYWGRRWSEALQADYLRAFYTMAFAHASVKAIVWKDALDSSATIEHGGLFRKPGSPKPAFFALRDLIRGWTTNTSGATDLEGRLRLRGFAGDYQVTVRDALTGEATTLPARIREGELDTVYVDLPDTWLPPEPIPVASEP